jgi:bacterioferritin-associated ferredoxin
MFVCICNGHRDREIRDAARSGLRCAREIYRRLGKPARCGRCLDFAGRLVDEVHAEPPESLARESLETAGEPVTA